MISCGCGGAMSWGSGQHGIEDCSSRLWPINAGTAITLLALGCTI